MSTKAKKNAKPKTASARLPPKQQKFADEYLVSHNATTAYHAAGYKCKDDHVAGACAARLLASASVAKYVAERAESASARAEIDTAEVLNEARRLANSDFRKLFGADGNMKAIDEIDDDTAACVASVEVDELFDGRGENKKFIGYTKKIKLWDKNAALDKLMRHLALYKDAGSSKDTPINHTHRVIVEFKDAD